MSLLVLAGCSAGQGGDDSDAETVNMFNVPNNMGSPAGAAGATNNAPGNNPTPGNTTAQPQGNGGSSAELPGSNVNNVASPNNMQMQSGNGAAGAGNGAAGSGAAGNGNVMGGAGAGGAGNQPPPVPVGGPGRVGVENCPAGPFGAPLPAAPQVSKLFSVGENNFFNFEGAVWVGDALYFSEIGNGNNPPPSNINRFVPGGTMERGVFKDTGSNGLGVDAQGNLIATNHKDGRISIIEVASGTVRDYGATTFNNARFDSPNDLVQRADGNVYFTDPAFQAPNPNPQNATRVYRIPPQGAATVVDASLSNPNGITLSPDGNRLYVTSASGFRRYDLAADGTPGPAISINLQDGLQTPDGMTVDCAGNVYTIENERRLIRVFDRDGVELGRFGGQQVFDNNVTNMAFGGADRRTLFVTTFTQGNVGGVFSVQLNIPGFPY